MRGKRSGEGGASGSSPSCPASRGRPSVNVPVLSKAAISPRQPLQAGNRLDHDAVLEQAARGHHLHDRHRQPQRAGTGDDEHGDGDADGAVPVAGGGHPARRSGTRRHAPRRIKLRRAVGQPAIAGAPAFGRFHQAHHLGQNGLFRAGGGNYESGPERFVVPAAAPSRGRRAGARFRRWRWRSRSPTCPPPPPRRPARLAGPPAGCACPARSP